MTFQPHFLALEGALGPLSVAYRHGSTIIVRRARGNDALEQGLTLIDEVLNEAGITLREINAFACSLGPGGFTGLRIALAFAKSLAQAWKRPLFGISSYDAVEHLAETIEQSTAATDETTAYNQPSVLTAIFPRTGVVCARLRIAATDALAEESARSFFYTGTEHEVAERIAQTLKTPDLFPHAEPALRLISWPQAGAAAFAVAVRTASAHSDLSTTPMTGARGDQAPAEAVLEYAFQNYVAGMSTPSALHSLSADYGEPPALSSPTTR